MRGVGPSFALRGRNPPCTCCPQSGSLHESYAHERLKAYVCVLHDSLCAPLLVIWPGEVEETSLAMA